MTTTTSDRTAFIRAICENPEDITLRLIFADWLEERGESEQAEFIRVQVELANNPAAYLVNEDDRRLANGNENPVSMAALHSESYQAAVILRRRELELLKKFTHLAGLPFGREQYGPREWRCFPFSIDFYKPQMHYQLSTGNMMICIWRRGFVESAACRLEDWIGRPCTKCGGDGIAESSATDSRSCQRCHGIGRLDAHGPMIVAQQPITEVQITDRTAASGAWYVDDIPLIEVPGESVIPRFLWCITSKLHYEIREPKKRLSAGLIYWAREQAKLPNLL